MGVKIAVVAAVALGLPCAAAMAHGMEPAAQRQIVVKVDTQAAGAPTSNYQFGMFILGGHPKAATCGHLKTGHSE